MAYSRVYTKTTAPQLATYDYFDIAEGTGVKTFYCAATSSYAISASGVTTDFASGVLTTDSTLLSGNTHYDATASSYQPWETAAGGFTTLAAWNIAITKWFTTTFNLPKNIKGTIRVNAGYRGRTTTTNRSGRYYLEATFYKNLVQFAAASGAQAFFKSSIALDQSGTFLLDVPVTSVIHFKKGDVLSVKIDVWCYPENSNNFVTLGHDPAGRDPSAVYPNTSTKLRVDIPFRLGL